MGKHQPSYSSVIHFLFPLSHAHWKPERESSMEDPELPPYCLSSLCFSGPPSSFFSSTQVTGVRIWVQISYTQRCNNNPLPNSPVQLLPRHLRKNPGNPRFRLSFNPEHLVLLVLVRKVSMSFLHKPPWVKDFSSKLEHG